MEYKVMPNSIQAEQSVLGTIFIDPNTILPIKDNLDQEDFYKKEHQIIFDAMVELANEKVDIDYTTVLEKIKTKNLVDAAGGIEYIISLTTSVPTTANFESYVKIVKEKSLKRKVIIVSQEAAELGFDESIETSDFIDMVERTIFNVTKNRNTGTFREIANVVDRVVENIESNSQNDGNVTGYKTGFSNVDKITFGFQKEDLMILAARPGVGKTAFALNLAVNLAKHNKGSVAIFSMEMSAEQLVGRILSRESSVDSKKFKTGDLDKNEWSRVNAAVNVLKKQRIYFDDGSGTNVQDLRAKCRKLKQQGELDFIVIDYLQLMSAGNQFGSNRQQEVSYISRTLKEVARELKVPVLALSQLSRGIESREDKRPKMSDLRESGSIEQDADMIMFLYRDDYYNKETERPNIIECNFAKNRHGENGVVEFRFQKECSMFNAVVSEYVDPESEPSNAPKAKNEPKPQQNQNLEIIEPVFTF